MNKTTFEDMATLTQWPHELRSITRAEIDEAVKDSYWQRFRLSLKGKSTGRKLYELQGYWNVAQSSWVDLEERAEMEVQVINYLNALKRGGQLSDKLEVIK